MEPKIFPAYDKEKDGMVPLYIYCSFNNEQIKFSTGKKCPTKDWDHAGQRIRGNTKDTGVKIDNLKLKEMVASLRNIYGKADLEGITITKAYLREEFARATGKGKQASKGDFFTLIEDYVASQRGILADGYLRRFNQVRGHLKIFSPQLSAGEVTTSFFNRYLSYLINTAKLSDNTIATHVSAIRSVMSFAEQNKGLAVKKDYLNFESARAETERIYLTRDELMRLWRLPQTVTLSEAQSRALDVFLFSCFTGLRWQDVRSLRAENWHGDRLILTQHKAKNRNELPLSDYAREILERNKGGAYALPVTGNLNSSNHAKELCKLAGIDQPIQRVLYRGSKRVETTVPKYTLCSFHIGRHTFATLSLEMGMPVELLQKFMGHKLITSTMIYGKVSEKRKAAAIKQYWKKED